MQRQTTLNTHKKGGKKDKHHQEGKEATEHKKHSSKGGKKDKHHQEGEEGTEHKKHSSKGGKKDKHHQEDDAETPKKSKKQRAKEAAGNAAKKASGAFSSFADSSIGQGLISMGKTAAVSKFQDKTGIKLQADNNQAPVEDDSSSYGDDNQAPVEEDNSGDDSSDDDSSSDDSSNDDSDEEDQ